MKEHYKIEKRMSERAEAALDLLLALAIGVGLAFAIIEWWTA